MQGALSRSRECRSERFKERQAVGSSKQGFAAPRELPSDWRAATWLIAPDDERTRLIAEAARCRRLANAINDLEASASSRSSQRSIRRVPPPPERKALDGNRELRTWGTALSVDGTRIFPTF